MPKSFTERYNTLNPAQQQAVDTIEGPLMVVAGPGTGKTELLSMRVANILKSTDTLPEAILCLTFTESGAAAMRQRLLEIIGDAAYKVAIHTFHSFGADVIHRYGEYFYDNADFTAADELTTYEIVHSLLNELPHSNPLSVMHGGEFVYMKSLITTLSDLKRSGLTSSELLQILASNNEVIDGFEAELSAIFAGGGRMPITKLSLLVPVAERAAAMPDPAMPSGITPLNHVLATSLAHAIDAAQASNKMTPITAWRNAWLEKDAQNTFVFKARKQVAKLQAAVGIYDGYLTRLRENGFYDYDDMILEVLHALEVNAELRYNLQESYLYLLVDEFQDTNLAQARLLTTLADNPVVEGKPNLMVVGDDDQAIFEFQGADISNILNFQKRWPAATQIVLTDNYRSSAAILAHARGVITTIDDRLEAHSAAIEKTLTPHAPKGPVPQLIAAPSPAQERQWLADAIAQQIKSGTSPASIAVFARQHSELVQLVPYLAKHSIPVTYEKRENILDEPVVRLVLLVCRIIQALSDNDHHMANALLPELLSHPAWQHTPGDIYRVSLAAYHEERQWLECMQMDTVFNPVATWLLSLVEYTRHAPLEQVIDAIIGEPVDADSAPFHAHFFGTRAQAANAAYLTAIEAVRTLRDRVRTHFSVTTPTVTDLIELVELYVASATPVTRVSQYGSEDAVHIMSAHKSKGLEFDHVYILDATDKHWGEKVRSPSQKITYPVNIPLARAGGSLSERTRLFFVAMTRAKRTLTISYSTHDHTGKVQLPASFLAQVDLKTQEVTLSSEAHEQAIITDWYTPLLAPPHDTLRDALAPTLATYKLSPTHLGAFLNIAHGGPEAFLLYNILRFPSAMSPHAAYGSAIHAALQRAHGYFTQHGTMRALEDSQHDFTEQLLRKHLAPDDLAKWRARGIDTLQTLLPYCEKHLFSTGQKAEVGFAHQQAMVNSAHLTGQLDLISIDTTAKTIEIYDYKTGKPAHTWQGKDEYDKIRLHKYRQQLLFYQLLLGASRDYHDYTVTGLHLLFAEPHTNGEIIQLSHQATTQELSELRTLVQAVYHAVTTVYLPDTSAYPQTLKGIQQFEQDLVAWHQKTLDQDS